MTESAIPEQPLGPFLRDYAYVRGFRHIGARTTSVILYGNGSYSIVNAHGSVTHGRPPLLRKSPTVCEIISGRFQSSLALRLPAKGGATFFDADIDIQWRVEDPFLVAQAVVRDVVQELQAPVLERLREITQQYAVHDAPQANEAVTAECGSGRWDDLGDSIGLWTRLFVRLTVDQKVIDATERRRDADTDHGLRALQMKRFRQMLAGDQMDHLAFMMVEHKQDAHTFLEQLRQENRGDHLRLQEHVLGMISDGRLHSSELEGQMRALLEAHSPYPIEGPLGPRPVLRDQNPPRALERLDDEPYPAGQKPRDRPWWVEDQEPPARTHDPDAGDTGSRSYDRETPAVEPADGRPDERDGGWPWTGDDA